MLFKFNVTEGNEKIHKRIIMYGAVVVMVLDISLGFYNYFASSGTSDDAQAATVNPQAAKTPQNKAANAAKIAAADQGNGIAFTSISAARNPIIHWYEYYFCRGFQSAYGCSNRPLRASTSLDLDPYIAAQNRMEPKIEDDRIILDTYNLDIIDKAKGNTELK